MNLFSSTFSPLRSSLFMVGVVATLTALPACSSSDTSSPGGGTTTTTPGGASAYKGTFTGAGGDGGSVEINVAAATGTTGKSLHLLAETQQVTGNVRVSGGSNVAITGTYDPATGKITVSGGGYTFTGTLTSTSISGTYTGPKGAGSFTLLTGTNVTPYCGTFAGDASGVWNFVVAGSTVVGTATESKGNNTDTISGTANGNALSLTTKNGSTATGTIAGNAASGTWENTAGKSKGTWTGTSGCL